MTLSPRSRTLIELFGLAGIYVISGKLGLGLAFANPSATAVWPCTGIALAAFLILGYRVWPSIFVGAFLVNLTTAGSVATSLCIAMGNVLEGVVGCYLVKRFASGQHAFVKAQDIFKFAFLAGMVSTTVSATVGVTTLSLGGLANWSQYGPIWCTWWLGDAVGAMLVTPVILLWSENPHLDWTQKQILELTLLFFGLFITSWVVFGARFHAAVKDYPLEYLCVPFVIWAAFRFGRRKAATAICALAAMATWGTLQGFGPFSRGSQNTSLLLLQGFLGIMAVTILALAAETTEHKRADQRVYQLAVTDPLTGIGNYRRLVDALDSEIKRHGRTERPFAVLLLDLDGLKEINDIHGHPIGSRALCRLATALRIHCREVDTAARYGGDEFVLVLPETDAEGARHAAQRISDVLEDDKEEPKLSVSTGLALCPRDGKSLQELLRVADEALYRNKRYSRRKSVHLSPEV